MVRKLLSSIAFAAGVCCIAFVVLAIIDEAHGRASCYVLSDLTAALLFANLCAIATVVRGVINSRRNQ